MDIHTQLSIWEISLWDDAAEYDGPERLKIITAQNAVASQHACFENASIRQPLRVRTATGDEFWVHPVSRWGLMLHAEFCLPSTK
jgi:hypothetical protein